MEIIYLILLTASCLTGLWITNNHGAKIFSTKLNFAVWYFIVEFFLTAVLATYTIDNVGLKTNWVFRLIPEAEFPRFQVIWILTWSAIAIPVGFIVANFSLKKLKLMSNYEDFLEKKFVDSFNITIFEKLWLGIVLFYTAFVIYKIGFIPQIESLSWSPLEISHFRGKMTHNFPASVHLKELIGLRIIPILSFYYFSKFLRVKTKPNFLLALAHIVLSIFFVSINLNKSGIAFYSIGLIITYGIVKTEIRFKHILISFAIVFTILLGSYSMVRKDLNLVKLTKGIYHRVVYTQAYGNYYSLHYFPQKHEHLGFSSISKFIKKFGFNYSPQASRLMMKVADKKGFEDGRAGYLTSSFISEAWANWGIFGIIFGPIFVGFIIKFLIGLLISLPKTDLSCALIAFSSYALQIGSGINNIIFPRYLIATLSLFFITYKLTKKKQGKNR